MTGILVINSIIYLKNSSSETIENTLNTTIQIKNPALKIVNGNLFKMARTHINLKNLKNSHVGH
jgi:FMN-dependent NADH-azoreductase